MIRRIIRFSAENRFLVLAATLVLLAFSVWSMRTIPLDAIPDLSYTQVIVYYRLHRSRDIITDQVTYTLTNNLLIAHHVTARPDSSTLGHRYL